MKHAVHICFPEDMDYIARAEDAQRRLRKGERQRQCSGCKLWFWADEMKYHPQMEVDAQHDTLYAGGPKPDALEDNDRAEMKNLGWTYDIQEASWRRFT